MAHKTAHDITKATERLGQSAAEFNKTLKDISAALEGDIGTLVKSVSLELFSAIISRTPLDSGYARANMRIGNNFFTRTLQRDRFPRKRDTPLRVDPPQHGAVASDPKKDQKFDPLQNVFIFNAVPYIEQLEAGSSKQAGDGMFANSITNFDIMLRRALKENRLDTYIKR